MTKQKNCETAVWKVFNWDTSHVNEFQSLFLRWGGVAPFQDVCLLNSLAWPMKSKNRVQIPILLHPNQFGFDFSMVAANRP